MKTKMRMNIKPLLASLPFALIAAQASAVQVDLLVTYDNYSKTYFDDQVATAMKGWVNQMNAVNENSKVDIQWRLVGVMPNNDTATEMGDVLRSLRANTKVADRRTAVGADFVVQISKSGACGSATMSVTKEYAFSVVGPACGPLTMAHELGHGMGLNHSRRQGDTAGARYDYGLGYGVVNKFSTIMAYSTVFKTDKIPKYSNPRLTCFGVPCGVAEGQAQQADAAKALTKVRVEVAGFFPTKTLTLADPSGGVTVFQHAEQGGYSATLSPGSYPLADLQRKGIGKNDLASAKVPAGYTLELYSGDNFTGTKTVLTADSNGFQPAVSKATSSLIVKGPAL